MIRGRPSQAKIFLFPWTGTDTTHLCCHSLASNKEESFSAVPSHRCQFLITSDWECAHVCNSPRPAVTQTLRSSLNILYASYRPVLPRVHEQEGAANGLQVSPVGPTTLVNVLSTFNVQPSIRGYLDPLDPRFLLPVRFASVWELCTNYKVQLRFLVRCSFGDLAGGGRADSEGTARIKASLCKGRNHIR